ncbi:twin-arginine translocase subunit TatC [Turicibacter sp. TJ11]|uniref:twin-arginine translocase subunit TatC n=1 Tax=Turicibacter sp. TJ11 TaxID=2806443 RepID=UPI001F3633BD|nr:twin-arginine translocase subunit TatC [Turicibacter sp. TJ11]
MGLFFCYTIVLPTTFEFFVNIAVSGIKPMISIESFVSFISTMILGFGLVFEMPMVILLLSMLGLVTPNFLIKQHPIFVMAIFIAAAFITSPDVVSLLLAVPMILLFEISIGLSWLVQLTKKRKKQ